MYVVYCMSEICFMLGQFVYGTLIVEIHEKYPPTLVSARANNTIE